MPVFEALHKVRVRTSPNGNDVNEKNVRPQQRSNV